MCTNMTSTTAASCLVATSPLESFPNVGEKPNQPKRFLLPKHKYGKKLKTVVKHAFQQLIACIPAHTHEPTISAGYIIQMAIQYSIWL